MQRVDERRMPEDVASAFRAYPEAIRERLLLIRALILATAKETEGVGPLNETLKWGEPAYLTEASKSGSTIRLGRPKSSPECAGVFFNCQTTLVFEFRDIFPGVFHYDGNRALLLPVKGAVDEVALRQCFVMALTYHRKRRTGTRRTRQHSLQGAGEANAAERGPTSDEAR